MRVTHVITRLIIGGAQQNTVDSVLGLNVKSDLQVDLVTGPTDGPEGSLVPFFKKKGGQLTILPNLVRPIHPIKDWLALRALIRLFRKTKPQIVHTHSGKAGILGRLAAHFAGVPTCIHTIHGPSFGPFQGALSNCLFRAAERFAARSTTHFVSVAHAMTQQYLHAGIGRPQQFTRILSGFRLQPFLHCSANPALRERLGLAPDDFVIGKIARLATLKGHDDLIRIAPVLVQRCPKIKFLLVGDGPLLGPLEKTVAAQGLQTVVRFAGLVPPEDIPAFVAIMDAVVHLSEREGLPRALSQALAAAKPVVAYDCDGASEVCITHQTGFLVTPGDTDHLVQCLLQLSQQPQLCRQLGQQGQALVRDAFSVEKMVDDLYTLYQRLLPENSSSPRADRPHRPPLAST